MLDVVAAVSEYTAAFIPSSPVRQIRSRITKRIQELPDGTSFRIKWTEWGRAREEETDCHNNVRPALRVPSHIGDGAAKSVRATAAISSAWFI